MTRRAEGEGLIQVMVRLPERLVLAYRHMAVDQRVSQARMVEILIQEALDARQGEGR